MNTIQANTASSTGPSIFDQWGFPELIKTIELQDSIQLLYKQTSMITYTIWPARALDTRVYKIIFSCKEGRWHKSEPIYGKIISAQEESYEFED